MPRVNAELAQAGEAGKLPAGWLARWPWITFVLPMVVYMVVGTFEPTPSPVGGDEAHSMGGEASAIEGMSEESAARTSANLQDAFEPAGLSYKYYPCVYTTKIVLTLITMVLVWPGYRTFPWRVSGLSVGVGVAGVVLWVTLCHLRLEPKIIGPVDRFLGSLLPVATPAGTDPTIGLMSILGSGERSAYNPLAQLADSSALAYSFLVVRFIGLALLVPVIEEFFLRGFLMRYVIEDRWWQVPFGTVNRTAIIVGTAIPMLMHPGELLAAFAWFSLVTWLMVRTRNIWDCVVAHAVTNGLLGAYVVATGNWQLM